MASRRPRIDRDHTLVERLGQRHEADFLRLECLEPAAELLGKAVHGTGEITDFTRRCQRWTPRQIARSERPRHVAELDHRPRDGAGEQPHQHEREQQRHTGGHAHVGARASEQLLDGDRADRHPSESAFGAHRGVELLVAGGWTDAPGDARAGSRRVLHLGSRQVVLEPCYGQRVELGVTDDLARRIDERDAMAQRATGRIGE
jgi:hypothetical protein